VVVGCEQESAGAAGRVVDGLADARVASLWCQLLLPPLVTPMVSPPDPGSLGMNYFTIPACLLTSAAHWSLAELSGSEVRVYIAILWIANLKRSHRFERTHAEMYRTAGLTSLTFKNALDGLQRHGLIFVSEGETTNKLVIHICDPFTGEPMHAPDGNDRNDPARYFTTDGRRFSWNGGTDGQWEQIVRDAVSPGEPITKQRNGDLLIRCPFHDDRTHLARCP
jgi:hypothetical protein